MDVSRNDSFSISSELQLLGKKCFHTSVDWNIACAKNRLKRDKKVISPIFQCSKASWQLSLSIFSEHRPIAYIRLRTVDETLVCSFLLHYMVIILDEKGNTLHKCASIKELISDPVEIKVSLTSKKKEILILLGQHPLKISFHIFVEELNIQDLPFKKATEVLEDEKKKSLRLCCNSNSLAANFEELYNNPKFSDVTLKVDNKVFQAHKSVLSSRSKVFATVFEQNMRESWQNTLELEQIEVETVQDMLRYIYCGKVRELSPEHALNLYVAAHRYELQELKGICQAVVLNNVSIGNICNIALVANLHQDELLMRAITPYFSEQGDA